MILKLEIEDRDVNYNFSKCKKENIDGKLICFDTVNIINANKLIYNYDEYNGVYDVKLITDNDEVLECVDLIIEENKFIVILDLAL